MNNNKKSKKEHLSKKSMEHRFDYLLHSVLTELEQDNFRDLELEEELQAKFTFNERGDP